MAYATVSDFLKKYPNAPLQEREIAAALAESSTDVDSLTFNRIREVGFENLTEFQKEKVSESVLLQANFRTENAELLQSPLSSYSINGVSMSFGGKSLVTCGDVLTTRSVTAALAQTGLMCRRLV